MEQINNYFEYNLENEYKKLFISEFYYDNKILINISENENLGTMIEGNISNNLDNIHYNVKTIFGNSIYNEKLEYLVRVLIEYLNKYEKNNIYKNKNLLFGFGFKKDTLSNDKYIEELLIILKDNYKKILKVN